MKRGFTLIEMMIVIAVIAILVGISLPHFRGMQEEGWTVEAAGELRTLATALESYYIHNNRQYPSQATSPATDWQSSLPGNGPIIVAAKLYDPFLPGTTGYSYATSAQDTGSKYYVVFSVGSDGTANIEGIDDANGVIVGGPGDDIYFTNSQAGTGGF